MRIQSQRIVRGFITTPPRLTCTADDVAKLSTVWAKRLQGQVVCGTRSGRDCHTYQATPPSGDNPIVNRDERVVPVDTQPRSHADWASNGSVEPNAGEAT